jgi:hypothetical protein
MKYLCISTLLVCLGTKSNAQVSSFDIDSAKFNKPLMTILDSLYKSDQTSRYNYLDAVHKKANASVADSLLAIMRKKDQENLVTAKAIIDRYGWLGPQEVGMNASQGLFLIIQHADLSTQETYLPIIKSAEKQGKVLSSNLAILEDRILMRKGLKQVYGSQGFSDKKSGKKYFYPISDPDQVDNRRKSMGLIPMQEYANAINMEWNLQKYKIMLPELEALAASQIP